MSRFCRLAAILALLVLAALPLAACGKKGQPNPPSGEKNTYPRTYPAPNNGDPETDEAPNSKPADQHG